MNKSRNVLSALWNSLFDVNQPPARYLGRALLVDLPVSLPLAVLVTWLFPTAGPHFPKQSPLSLLFGLCVLSPLVETLLMGAIFWLLRLFVRQNAFLVILSALTWAGLHALGALSWGLVIYWPFLVFSLCYLTWEKKSRTHAFWITALLHSLHNLLPAMALVVGGYA